jgi:two-component system, NarL family, sensor histidine kinase LiaS
LIYVSLKRTIEVYSLFNRKIITDKNILPIYRILSWFFTSLFYLFGDPCMESFFHLIVIFLLFISAVFVIWLYKLAHSRKLMTISLLIFEIVGIGILLIPTGTINSPFIWYAINPVIIAASLFPIYYGWMILVFYVVTSIIAYSVAGNVIRSEIFENNSTQLLVFILITLAVQLLTHVSKELTKKNALLEKQRTELEEMNSKLKEANNQNREFLDHFVSLYQVTESITSQENPENVIKAFSDIVWQLFKSDSAFYWMPPLKDKKQFLAFVPKANDPNYYDTFKNQIYFQWLNSNFSNSPTEVRIVDKEYLVVLVSSSTVNYGVMGFELENAKNPTWIDLETQLKFLANLFSIFFDRFFYEELNDELLLFEEQNRIANEIHDSVSQRLFSIVYAIHALKKKPAKENFHEQLKLIEDCSRSASQELRECIYRLSSKKNKSNQFILSLETYLDQISKLNNVTITLQAVDEVENLTIDKKQMILRIISESVGNALRHGKANKIHVKINADAKQFFLTVQDNGVGINLAAPETNPGLGLRNIKNLVNNVNGHFQLESTIGEGTKLTISWYHQFGTNVMEVS